MRLPRPALAALAVLPALVVLAGCGGGSSGSASGTSSAAGPSSSAAAGPTSGSGTATRTTSSGTWGKQAGCPSVGKAVPAGTRSKPTVDVDGDGRPDTAFITTAPDSTGAVTFGVRTASGGVFSTQLRSASPQARSVLFADVTGHGEVIALASDGRQVELYAVSQCQLIPEKNAQGKQYAFDLGFTGYGTGVGCVDANGDGRTDLVGLKYVPEAQGTGTIQRTIITLNGPNARNGATDTVPATNANLADEAHMVSCGDVSMAQNGVSSGP